MKAYLKIYKAQNGIIIKNSEGQLTIIPDGTVSDNCLALYEIAKELFEDQSRYSQERIYIANLPGDKYDGPLTKEQKDTVAWLKSLGNME